MNRIQKTILLVGLCLGVGSLPAAEYFVATEGDDAHDGLSRETSFRTVQKGVDALQPGDTLTILPGEYLENVKRTNLGSPEKDTLIRAALPGTVLLRGDVPAPEFKKVDGYRFVYAAAVDQEAQAVNELDTLTILEKMPDVGILEFIPGTFCYDPTDRKLYISSSDLQAPSRHHYTVSVNPRSGLYLEKPVRVVVEGLAATGFHRASHVGFKFGSDYIWGLALNSPLGCTVRDCTTFLNSGGICLARGSNNVIERCVSFANYSKYAVEGGNIFRLNGNNDVIRDCTASRSQQSGIRFYGVFTGPVHLDRNLAWGNAAGDLWIKGDSVAEFKLARNCVALQKCHVLNITNCVIGGENSYRRKLTTSTDNIMLKDVPALDPIREFADPDNMDFRLQATSQFRGSGPDGADRGAYPYATNVFYVAGDGDDQQDGLSVDQAWKTMARAVKSLRPGDTLYLAGGNYEANLTLTAGKTGGKKICIRGRGSDPVTLHGSLRINQGVGLTFERLTFADPLDLQNSQSLTFNNCAFTGLTAHAIQSLEITHGRFSAPLQLKQCADVFLSGNLYTAPVSLEQSTVQYSDYNGYPSADACWVVDGASRALAELQPEHDRYSRVVASAQLALGTTLPEFIAGGPLGTPLGPFREFKKTPLRHAGPYLHSTSPTTANIELWTSHPAVCTMAWGDTPTCVHTNVFKAYGFASYSLTGLKPGATYHVRLGAIASKPVTDPLGLLKSVMPTNAPLVFQTDSAAAAPRRLYVAPDGDDRHDGLSRTQAWRTVMAAADRVRAGDTVLIAGGTYREMVRMRVSGSTNAPITFKTLPGEKVVFDGVGRTLTSAFIAKNKHNLRFDGFYFIGFNNANHDSPLTQCAVFLLSYCSDIDLTRCFMDGRGPGYSPKFLNAFTCADLLVKNCVIMSGFSGMHTWLCPGLRIQHCLFLRNLITALGVTNAKNSPFCIRDNIFSDGLPVKVGVFLLNIGVELDELKSLDEGNNCFFVRLPDAERKPLRVARVRMSLADYVAAGARSDSILADPQFVALQDLDRPVTGFPGDRLMGLKLDFDRLFATNPEVVRRGIGLVPEDFKDFHFNTATNRIQSAPNKGAL